MRTERLYRRLPELLAEHGVVGAQVPVLADGEIVDVSAGVLNAETRAPVTSASLFQLASITKIWTATLVQEQVNEGLLDLDRPVRDVLRDFRLADEQAARTVTPRRLPTHTPGVDGDLFFDTGTGADTVERFVALLADARAKHRGRPRASRRRDDAGDRLRPGVRLPGRCVAGHERA